MSAPTTMSNETRRALHDVAEDIDAYLEKHYAPPVWWRLSDIAHTAAGCMWDDAAGDGGAYDCESS